MLNIDLMRTIHNAKLLIGYQISQMQHVKSDYNHHKWATSFAKSKSNTYI